MAAEIERKFLVAEVEVADESISLSLPPWAGAEVSSDARYFNSCLATAPFKKWFQLEVER